MKKIKYIIKRIFSMNFKNFFKTIDDVHKITKKSKIYLFFDIVFCGFKYQAGYMDYQLFEMYKMNKEERRTIITRGVNNDLIKKYNNPEFGLLLRNKIKFNAKFSKYLNREWFVVDGNNFDEFKTFLKGKKAVMIKPEDGTCGKRIEKTVLKDWKKQDLYNYLLKNKIYLVEEVAVQCKEISALHPSSINTVRVVTLNGKVVVTFLRIGSQGKVVDNFNSEGMVVPVDTKDGIIKFPAIDKLHNTHSIHPYTNVPIVGVQIPRWKEVIKLCEKAAKEIPELGYIGWDVCVGKEKPFLIEANEFPGHDIYQLPPHRNGNTGLYPIFKKAMEVKK